MRRALAQHWVAREDAARTALAEQARAIARAKAQAKAEAKADGKGKKKGRGRGRKKQTAVPGAGQPGSVFASGTGGVGSDGLPSVSMGAGGLPSDQVSSVSAEQFRMSVAERASLEPVRDTTAEERESGRQLLIVDGTGALDAALLDWMQKVPPVPVPPSDGAGGDEKGGACRTIGAVFDAAGWRRTEGKGSKRHEPEATHRGVGLVRQAGASEDGCSCHRAEAVPSWARV